jgi:glutathione S-transferase
MTDRDEAGTAAPGRYRLLGSNASPYALKMRAVLRYRRIAHDWIIMNRDWRARVAHVKPNLIPFLQYPGEEAWHIDSTALIAALEERHRERSVRPPDPAVAFLNDLLEDLADEWAVKTLFIYRWSDPDDQAYVGRWGGYEWGTSTAPAGSDEADREFRDRQVGRMPLIGAAAENFPLLEACYHRIIDSFEAHVAMDRFLFGSRPSAADFAWYGQLTQLAIDPTPMAVMRGRGPKTDLWRRWLDDLSGHEGEWWDLDACLSGAAGGLLELAGDVYLPFLIANAAAFRDGKDTVTLSLGGLPYRQGVFRFQVKCLDRLRHLFGQLDADAKTRLEPALRQSGCWNHLILEETT